MYLLKFILAISLFLNGACFSQKISEDALLQTVVDKLPEGWSAKIENDLFSIEYKDSTWTMKGNWVNANPAQLRLKKDSVRIKSRGQKVLMRFEFKLIKKMTPKQLEKFKKKNPDYTGSEALRIYSSQNYSLLQKKIPALEDEYNTIWPKKTGVTRVDIIMNRHLR